MLLRGCLLLAFSGVAQGETIVFLAGEDANGFTKDAHIAAGSASSENHSDDGLLQVDMENGGFDNNESRALIAFPKAFGNLDGQLPAHALVEQALLSLYIVNEGGTLSAHALQESWDNATVSWSSRGGELGSWQSAGAGHPSSDKVATGSAQTPVDTTVTLDLTNAVEMWALDPSTNHGILLVSDSTDGTDIISSENSGSPTLRPTLTITYTLGEAPDTAEEDTGTTETAAGDTARSNDEGACGCAVVRLGSTAGWVLVGLVGWRRRRQ